METTVVVPCRSSVTKNVPSGCSQILSTTREGSWTLSNFSSTRRAMSRPRPRRAATLVDGPHFLVEVVHQDELSERVRRREIGLAPAHLADLLDEGDEVAVAGEHEGVDHDALALAVRDLFQGERHDPRVEAEGVAVDAPVVLGQRGRLAVRDHDDLLHVLALGRLDALGHAQPFW